jgi:ATP-dependent DNA ligase
VRWSTEGRLEFEALQRRNSAGRRAAELARAEPCHYVVFDLLERDGEDIRQEPLSVRRAALEETFARVPDGSPLTLGLQTGDLELAQEWFDSLAAVGIEGLVIKGAGEPYRSGARGWRKVKHYATTEAVIGGVTGDLARPLDLILGRRSAATGGLVMVGRTTALDDRAALRLGAVLRAADEQHPWPDYLPPSWTSTIYGRREPVPYLRVVPEVVVEVQVDVASLGGRWRHPLRLVRIRPDLRLEDLPKGLSLEA